MSAPSIGGGEGENPPVRRELEESSVGLFGQRYLKSGDARLQRRFAEMSEGHRRECKEKRAGKRNPNQRKLALWCLRGGGLGSRSTGKRILDLNPHIGGILKALPPVFPQAAPQQQADALWSSVWQPGPVR